MRKNYYNFKEILSVTNYRLQYFLQWFVLYCLLLLKEFKHSIRILYRFINHSSLISIRFHANAKGIRGLKPSTA